MSSADRLQVQDAVGTFIEEEVHDGKIFLEAVFPGEDLEIRLLQFQVFQNCVRTFRVDGFPEIFADDPGAVRRGLDSVLGEICGQAQVDCEACLFDEEPGQSHIEVQKLFRPAFHDGEQFVLVVFEIC